MVFIIVDLVKRGRRVLTVRLIGEIRHSRNYSYYYSML